MLIQIRIYIDIFDWIRMRVGKNNPQKEKVKKCLLFRSTGCFLFEGWRLYLLDVLHGGPGKNYFFSSKILPFLVSNSWVWIRIDLNIWDPDPH
jgi:hypothetical protein